MAKCSHDAADLRFTSAGIDSDGDPSFDYECASCGCSGSYYLARGTVALMLYEEYSVGDLYGGCEDDDEEEEEGEVYCVSCGDTEVHSRGDECEVCIIPGDGPRTKRQRKEWAEREVASCDRDTCNVCTSLRRDYELDDAKAAAATPKQEVMPDPCPVCGCAIFCNCAWDACIACRTDTECTCAVSRVA